MACARGQTHATYLRERGVSARALRHLGEHVQHGKEVRRGGQRLRQDALVHEMRGELGGGRVAAGVHELSHMRVELREAQQPRTHQPLQ